MKGKRTARQVLHAILSDQEGAGAEYQVLPDKTRERVIDSLGEQGFLSLTRSIKKGKSKVFSERHNNFLTLAREKTDTPLYILDEQLIRENMLVMRYIKDRTGCRVLHALKAFASFVAFPVMSRYLNGTCASGLYEARLGREEFGKEVHTFSAAYRDEEMDEILGYSDVIIFNSFFQLDKYGQRAKKKGVGIGLRVNPGHSEVTVKTYDPCSPCSRLGITSPVFSKEFSPYRSLVEGLHFHALCEQNADVLERVVTSFTNLYGSWLPGLRWVNFGGGHHLTRDDYDVERLVRIINAFKAKFGVQVYLEPGEASVYKAGVLVASVLDIVHNDMEIAILDASAEAHMPDVLLMPYRPDVLGSGKPGEKTFTYRLAGPSCLAGDVMGDYSFDRPLQRGDRLVFTDMALYSIVKNTTFNGIKLPDIAMVGGRGKVRIARRFGYEEYRERQS